MVGFLIHRLAAAFLLLFLVATATFFLLHAAPGDPTRLLLDDPRIPRQQRTEVQRIYGLDQPLHQQYLTWLANAARGDWGLSLSHQRPVVHVLADALPNTLLLALGAVLVDTLFGLGLGVFAARRRGAPADHLVRIGSLLVYSLPIFWTGLVAILVFSHALPLFPASHMHTVGAETLPLLPRMGDLVHHLFLPAMVLGLASAGATVRFVRNSLLEVLQQDYVLTARARGLSEARVVWVHALRNALVPFIQLFGLSFPVLLSGALVVEVVFSWPGLGRITYGAIHARDYPLVLAGVALSGGLVVAGNLLADLLHALADPRLRHV